MKIVMEPIGYVHSDRIKPIDDNWDSVSSYIELANKYPIECIDGLHLFSHIEVIYYFNQVDCNTIIYESEHPRENKNWPKVGIFAQRKKSRPNLIGATIAKIEKIEGKKIYLSHFDAIDQTPVLDIKPIFKEYLPDNVVQPIWVSELMENYW